MLHDPSELKKKLRRTMLCDRRRLRGALGRLSRRASGDGDGDTAKQLGVLAEKIARSARRAAARRKTLPAISYDPELPITAEKGHIAELLRRHQTVIVCGETGSGKSTQLPKICLEIGRGIYGKIGHTQPRRIAARTIARRLSEELGTEPGTTVGFKVRFTDHTVDSTLVKIMTDGVLLAESQTDPLFEQYDTIIIDEAHERSLNIDFLLGMMKRVLERRRDLKLIITSATIDAKRFAEHFAVRGKPAPIVEIAGRTYPIEIAYHPLDELR
ncbi:MAG: DEAD/DEAH box helicase, partial [Thermoguttaceae bacterium]|nr:DEAD/DEAH box helicase [Thermoguttaceae bacterium]